MTFTAKTIRGIGFEELEGSPTERISRQGGLEATREFRCDWADRYAFAGELYGVYVDTNGTLSYTPPVQYPGDNQLLLVDEVSMEPFDGSNPDGTAILNLSTGLPSYSNGARVKVTYRQTTSNDQNGENTVNVPEGTYASYESDGSIEYTTVPGTYWEWVVDNKQLTTDISPGLQIPITAHHVTWHNVISPPFSAQRTCRGAVNNATFLGAAAGTLLCMPAKNKVKLQLAPGAPRTSGPAVIWDIEYTFLEKDQDPAIHYGWNWFFRYESGLYELIQTVKGGHDPPFREASFSTLFQFA